MSEPFIYMLKDKNFYKKYLILLIFIIIANLFINGSSIYAQMLSGGNTYLLYNILYIIGFVILFVPYGYSISLLKSLMQKEDGADIPNITILSNFFSGLKVILSGVILLFVLFIIFFALGFFSELFSGLIGDIISTTIMVVSLLILMIMSFLGIAMCCRYTLKPSFVNFINIKSAINIIKNDVDKYFKAYAKTLILAVLVYGISIIAESFLYKIGYIGLIIYSILVSVIWTYIIFVLAKIFANAVDPDKI